MKKFHLSENFSVNEVYCINLRTRKDRKLRMQRQARRRKFPVNFWKVEPNLKDPIAGCRTSHLNILKNARRRKLESILILEDDAQLAYRRLYVPQPPNQDWDMLYLGGDIQKVMDDESVNSNQHWKRAQVRMTHAYIVHRKMYDTLIDRIRVDEQQRAIDVIYCEDIHPNYQCYIVTPTIFKQFNGYSDVMGKDMDYTGLFDMIPDTSDDPLEPESELDEMPTEIEEGGDANNCRLKLIDISDEDLPPVSIVTPTYNRRSMFPLAVRNFFTQSYPKDKLEWIIVDDSDTEETVNVWIPEDRRIKYVRCEVPRGQRLAIGKKRNIGVANASYEYIVHMDDDDYYYPHSVMARVKMLLSPASTGKQCAFSTLVGTYDLLNNTSNLSFDVDSQGRRTRPCEATMVYTRDFWLDRKFNETYETSEGYHFIRGRWDACITYPYSFVILAFTHKTNLTKNLRRVLRAETSEKIPINFVNMLDKNTRDFISTIINTMPERN